MSRTTMNFLRVKTVVPLLLLRLLKTLWDHLDKIGICSKTIWNKVIDLVIKTVLR